jgi:hypothetical protein
VETKNIEVKMERDADGPANAPATPSAVEELAVQLANTLAVASKEEREDTLSSLPEEMRLAVLTYWDGLLPMRHLSEALQPAIQADGLEAHGPVSVHRVLCAVASCPSMLHAFAEEGADKLEASFESSLLSCLLRATEVSVGVGMASVITHPALCEGLAASSEMPAAPWRCVLAFLYWNMLSPKVGSGLALDGLAARLGARAQKEGVALLEQCQLIAAQKRWLQPLLAATTAAALLRNNLWDADDAECRARMQERLAAAGLPPEPRFSLSMRVRPRAAGAAPLTPGAKAVLELEVRCEQPGADWPGGEAAFWLGVERLEQRGTPNPVLHLAPLDLSEPAGRVIRLPLPFVAPVATVKTTTHYMLKAHLCSSGIVGCAASETVTFQVVPPAGDAADQPP